MSGNQNELVRNWLIKARNDLESANILSKKPASYLDAAIYHCQQAVEKAIKGFLIYYNIRFEKKYDIEVLIHLAIPINPEFKE